MKTLNIILIGILITIIGFAAFFLFFNGSNTNGDSDLNDFIGGWTATETSHNESNNDILYYYWFFYENMTMNFYINLENETENTSVLALLLDYSLNGNELTLFSRKILGDSEMVYTYRFSEDKQELVATSTSNNLATLTFKKII